MTWETLPVIARSNCYRIFDDPATTTQPPRSSQTQLLHSQSSSIVPQCNPHELQHQLQHPQRTSDSPGFLSLPPVLRKNSAETTAIENIAKTDMFGKYHQIKRASSPDPPNPNRGPNPNPETTADPTPSSPTPAPIPIPKQSIPIRRTTSVTKALQIRGNGNKNGKAKKIRKGFKQGAMTAILATKLMQSASVKVDISKYSVFLPEIIQRDLAAGGGRFTNSVLSKRSSSGGFQAAVLMVDIR